MVREQNKVNDVTKNPGRLPSGGKWANERRPPAVMTFAEPTYFVGRGELSDPSQSSSTPGKDSNKRPANMASVIGSSAVGDFRPGEFPGTNDVNSFQRPANDVDPTEDDNTATDGSATSGVPDTNKDVDAASEMAKEPEQQDDRTGAGFNPDIINNMSFNVFNPSRMLSDQKNRHEKHTMFKRAVDQTFPDPSLYTTKSPFLWGQVQGQDGVSMSQWQSPSRNGLFDPSAWADYIG
ncbi:uncharacterized protein LOC106011787 [Aplysia californica]|uniref:Uncharacterized protein LOC106011787 n=1 Tax=Aplysia californica TaxID=6500 RepID=A0ABM1A032_APLCA|nr:uncharacterized protein LOC106011787 [Aplysia californica]